MEYTHFSTRNLESTSDIITPSNIRYYWFYIATVNDTKSLYETSSGEYRTKMSIGGF